MEPVRQRQLVLRADFLRTYPRGGPEQAFVSLTLNGFGAQKFILDTGSLGLVADKYHYTPNLSTDQLLSPYATITYSTSGNNPQGALYLTNVQINGLNGQSVTARVPVLASTVDGFYQLGVGFDRGGIMVGASPGATLTPANNSWNMNPFLSLVSGPGVDTMHPGYMIGWAGFSHLGLGSGVLLGLNSQNTINYAFQQLATGGLQAWYSVGGVQHPVQWRSQNGAVSITVGSQTYDLGSMSQLPDSGISYMIVTAPNNNVPVVPGQCSDSGGTQQNCLPTGGRVQVFLPGQTQAAYSFVLGTAGDPAMPYSVQVTDGSSAFTNLGRTFFGNLNYLYDPVNGIVGYHATGTDGTTGYIMPMLALQGTLATPDGFRADLPTFLMSNLTVQQTGSGSLNGPITGPGGLTLQGGNFTLGGANSYGGGTTVNGGLLTVANAASILGDVTVNGGGFVNNGTIAGDGLLTVNAGGSFVNNGIVDTPLQWQLNRGSFTNNSAFNGSLANAGLAINAGTLTGAVINTASGLFGNTGTITGSVSNMGWFANNGTIGGSVTNMGMLSGIGAIGGDLINTGVLAPGNSIGTLSVAGNYSQTGGTYQAEVNATGQGDRLNVTGTATIGAGATVSVLPQSGIYAARTNYTLLNAAGGVSGTYASVASGLPFLQPSSATTPTTSISACRSAASPKGRSRRTRRRSAACSMLQRPTRRATSRPSSARSRVSPCSRARR